MREENRKVVSYDVTDCSLALRICDITDPYGVHAILLLYLWVPLPYTRCHSKAKQNMEMETEVIFVWKRFMNIL